eukprot:CAMPEP_0168314292 /NCGR_PEP_ID=MMETSP0210-20121227/7076_1 /TAXON_ID=40633 /ORGANISM="Condylostoma magnum, Strain COL2" /LENGTH=69 /DNA_ID=CAMNT_0008280265 /DNA_START=6444 /DNA_END=6650 /DNA_ORIENTATION=+
MEEANKSKIVTITGLSHSTNYSCYYVCYNKYPTWPTPNEMIVTNVVTTQTADEEEEEDDYAEVLRALIA